MTVGVKTFCGERLKEARLARGLYKKSLADMIGVTGTAIARYEDGVDKPQHGRLVRIADQLRFPVDFFLRPAWPETMDLVFWRSRASETKNAREMTEQRMRWICEIFAFLEEEVDFPAFDLPPVALPHDFRMITHEDIERAALATRAHWRLGEHPVPDMILAMENAGVPVACLEIVSEKQDGFSFRSAMLGRCFVGINIYNVSAARARYDAAHELGHLVMHKYVTPQQSRDPSLHKMLEQQAHRFAGAFLFPRNAFLREVGLASLDYFSALKKRWGMSIAAMIFRAYDLGIIDDAEKAALYQNMTRRRWRGALREPFDGPEDMPLERPRMLRRGIEAVLSAGLFGRSTLRSALALPSKELEQLIGFKGDLFEEAELVQLAVPRRKANLKTVDLESGTVLEFPQRKM
jgi:Zn-dependent peptidase ImmA (M78 family)/transcriptional regulator with XRE-family HTH domain